MPDRTPIGDGPTQFGLDYNGVIRVERCCDDNGKGHKWADIRVEAAGRTIEIHATKRTLWIRWDDGVWECKQSGSAWRLERA